MKIKQRFASVTHPQANGQVEVTNRTILDGIRKRLEKVGGDWPNHLHAILWAHRTSPKEVNGETPFALVHGLEAVIPVEVGMESARILDFDHGNNDQMLREELDLVLEKREYAKDQAEANRARHKKAHDKEVRQRNFAVGDWVMRQADALKATVKRTWRIQGNCSKKLSIP